MAARTHPRGFRAIVVRGIRFRWRSRAGESDSALTVVGPERSGGRLVVVLRGWRDPWLALSGFAVAGDELELRAEAGNEPSVVGPGFVRAAIEWAIDAGWDYRDRAGAVQAEYRDHRFFRGA
jgi:hypothetical protein